MPENDQRNAGRRGMYIAIPDTQDINMAKRSELGDEAYGELVKKRTGELCLGNKPMGLCDSDYMRRIGGLACILETHRMGNDITFEDVPFDDGTISSWRISCEPYVKPDDLQDDPKLPEGVAYLLKFVADGDMLAKERRRAAVMLLKNAFSALLFGRYSMLMSTPFRLVRLGRSSGFEQADAPDDASVLFPGLSLASIGKACRKTNMYHDCDAEDPRFLTQKAGALHCICGANAVDGPVRMVFQGLSGDGIDDTQDWVVCVTKTDTAGAKICEKTIEPKLRGFLLEREHMPLRERLNIFKVYSGQAASLFRHGYAGITLHVVAAPLPESPHDDTMDTISKVHGAEE